MNMGVVEKIANTVLYEGYILYPYRPSSIKNRQRFNFGVLYPRQYCDLQAGTESWEMTTECLLQAAPSSTIEGKIRFLQMATRNDWQEGLERDLSIPPATLESVASHPYKHEFSCPGDVDADQRQSETIHGAIELAASLLDDSLYKVSLRMRNLTLLQDPELTTRDEALLQSMVSVHSILHAGQTNDGFVSLLEPPAQFQSAVVACHNVGTWPVLVGEEGKRDTILSSPIILYDYPQIAPESPGDLCDGTEIDEILALRILTMTDAEKLEMRNSDDRARLILERTETLPPEHFQKLHGAMRALRPTTGESQ